jgi:hypothetical protein
VYTEFAPYSPSYTLIPHPTPFPLIPTPTPQDLFCSPVLQFCKKKKWLFSCVRYTGTSLWHFHVYMCCNPSWFISAIFLLSDLVPLWLFQQV